MDKKTKRFLCKIKGVKEAFKNEMDVYGYIASYLFELPYEECLEWKDGKPYIDGQARRKLAKTIVTLMYESRYYPSHLDETMETLRLTLVNYKYKPDVKKYV